MTTPHHQEAPFIALADIWEIASIIGEISDSLCHLHNLPLAANIGLNRIETLSRIIRDTAVAGAEQGGETAE